MPQAYQELIDIAGRLEKHYREMQDMEFTIEEGRLWMLQTRDGKRTAQAAVRIAVDMAEEGLISQEEAVLRVTPDQVDFFLHPQFSLESVQAAREMGQMLASGLNVSPRRGRGGWWPWKPIWQSIGPRTRDARSSWCGRKPSPTTCTACWPPKAFSPAEGAAPAMPPWVARQFGKPAVVGVSQLKIDMGKRRIIIGEETIHEGDWISIDGTIGEIYSGQLTTTAPHLKDPWLIKLLSWADQHRRLGVRTNADYPKRCPSGAGIRRGRHRTVPHRAHVFRDRPAAPYPENDHGRSARRTAGSPGGPAALPAGGFRRAVPRHERSAGHHPADRPSPCTNSCPTMWIC